MSSQPLAGRSQAPEPSPSWVPALWGGGLTAAPGDILPPGSAPQEQLLLSSFSVPCQMSAVPLFLSEKPGAGRWGLLGPSHGGGRAGGAVGVPGALAWPPPAPGARTAIGQALSASDYRSSGRLWLQAPHSFQPSAALGRGQALRAAIAGRNQPQRCCGPAGRASPAGTHVCKRSPQGVCWLSGCCLGGNSEPEAHLAAHPGGRMLLGTPSAALPLSALKAGYVPVPRGGCSGMSRSTQKCPGAGSLVLWRNSLVWALKSGLCVCWGRGCWSLPAWEGLSAVSEDPVHFTPRPRSSLRELQHGQGCLSSRALGWSTAGTLPLAHSPALSPPPPPPLLHRAGPGPVPSASRSASTWGGGAGSSEHHGWFGGVQNTWGGSQPCAVEGRGVQRCPIQVPAGPRAAQQGTPGAHPCIPLLHGGTLGLGGTWQWGRPWGGDVAAGLHSSAVWVSTLSCLADE